MTVQTIKGYLEAEMRRHAFPYTSENGYITLTAGFGGKRWKMAFSCGENRIECYAAYPWPVPRELRESLLERLNSLNAAAGFGSYFLLDTERNHLIVLRCDILIADEYSIAECIEEGLKRMSAAFCARWETLMSASRPGI